MTKLGKLLEKAKNKDKEAMEEIILRFTPTIQKYLYQTSVQERNDLKQEINLKIIEAVYKYDISSIPGFWDFIESIDKSD
ncbi:helix-turn-helix domain-containing protein [Paenibacillus thiaminolyticus]|uniref:helix-turn-helix domain-containing protein n=1 Tax=Paenibacillus thiaminolyticus TaxID=49283 RepID=UPI0035A59F9C